MGINSEDNMLGMLRQRTEEEELKQHLKTTVGGFSKSSVLEYLAEMRKRHQTSSETFNENMQTLLEEKENLKTENEKLLMQIAQAKADFMRLAEAKKQQTASRTETENCSQEPKKAQQETCKAGTPNDNIVYLKSPVLEADTAGSIPKATADLLQNEMEALKKIIAEKDAELGKSKREITEQKELLSLEKLETKKQRDLASEFSATARALQEELDDMKERFSEEKLAEYNRQFAELTDYAQQQGEMLAQLDAQSAEKDDKIKDLLDENVKMMKSMELMSSSLDVLAIQNEKLLTANNALAQAFEDESRKVVKLINEKSEETVEKLILERKLEETVNTLSAAEKNPQNGDSKTSIA